MCYYCFFFFFQAEDGIRDLTVTGVQTCALPISDELPYKTHVGETYDSGDFARMLQGALRAADWAGFSKRKSESAQRGKKRGLGLAVYLEWTGALPTETVDIEIDAEGTVTVFSGTQAMGQGLETSYTQLVTELFGVDSAQVRIVQGDTDR